MHHDELSISFLFFSSGGSHSAFDLFNVEHLDTNLRNTEILLTDELRVYVSFVDRLRFYKLYLIRISALVQHSA
jgi:hypothetical protein